MDVNGFHAARENLLKERPISDPKKYKAIWTALHKSAEPEHAGKNIGSSMTDQIECSCGWKSTGYWDGEPYAWEDWLNHVADEMGLINKKCPCGKEYLPADGGKPCHELRPITE